MDEVLIRCRKFIPRVSLSKQRPSFCHGGKNFVVKTVSLVSHGTSPVTDLLIYDTGLLEWDDSSTNKGWDDKDPYGPGPLRTGSPESWLGWTKRLLLVTLWLGIPVCLTGHPVQLVQEPSGWQRPERIFSLATKPSSQDIEEAERSTLSDFRWGTHSKVCPNKCQSSENREYTSLWGWLEPRAYRMYACVLLYGFSLYDKWHKRQRQRKTLTISGRKGINTKQEYS